MRGVGVGVTQRCWLVLGYEEGSCACITSHCRGSECTKGCYTSRGVPPPQGFPFSRGISLLQRCPTSQSISLFQRCLTSTGISFLQRDFPHPEVSHLHRDFPHPEVSHFHRGFPFPEEFPTSRGVLCMAQFLLPSHRGWLHTRYKAATPSRWRNSTGKALFVSLDPFLPKTSVLVGNQTP